MPPSIISRIYNALNNAEPTHAEAEGNHSVDNDSDGRRGAPNTMVYFNDMDGRLRADKLTDHKPPVSPQRAAPHLHQRSLSLYDTTPIDLDQFITMLPTVVEKCETRNLKKCEPIKALLKRLVLESADVAPYAFWDPDKLYTRNLVATDSKNYTILLLCWNPGKESPIHDHPCEGCWVKTVQGCVKETVYEQSEEQGGALVPVRENTFHPDELSYIEDSLGFHKVGNNGNTPAMTLHIYIPPPTSCRVWLANHATLGEALVVPVCLYSAYGRRINHTSEQQGSASLTGP